MPRISRVVIPELPHHITQRGNYQQTTFYSNADYFQYLTWLTEYSRKFGVSFLAYCLMPNHVHFIAVPLREDSLAKTFNTCHMRYSQFFNKKCRLTGHLWQGRFFSCVMQESHLYAAIRYVENNPVRAKLVSRPGDWQWSSARAHLYQTTSLLPLEDVRKTLPDISDWEEYLGESNPSAAEQIRRHTLTGRPLGSDEFLFSLEKTLGCQLRALARGRPIRQIGTATIF